MKHAHGQNATLPDVMRMIGDHYARRTSLHGVPRENLTTADRSQFISPVSHAYFTNQDRQPAENLDPARDECGLIFFAPLVPAIGKEIQSLVEKIKLMCADHRLEPGLLFIQANPRTFLLVSLFLFDPQNVEEAERAQRTYDKLCEILEPFEYQQYRCTTQQMENILGCNGSYQRLLKALKAAVDPNQVIAPGRYGV